MTFIYRYKAVFICGLAVNALIPATAQNSANGSEYLPLPDPGYGLYYHDADQSPNPATRWGYHDGWMDGRRDRNHGEPAVGDDIRQKEKYLNPPIHGSSSTSGREQFNSLYRAAYTHGYDHGSRL